MKLAKMLALAKVFVSDIRRYQSIAQIGLGDTHPDLVATGFMLAHARGLNGVDVPTAMLMHAMVRWYIGGAPRFRITHGLATQLVLTDADGICAEDLHLPFPTVLIELPSPNGPLVLDQADQQPRDVSYVIVNRYVSSPRGVEPPAARSIKEILDHLVRERATREWSSPHLRLLTLDSIEDTVLDDAILLSGAVDAGSSTDLPNTTRRDQRCLEAVRRLVVNLALHLRHVPSLHPSGGRTVNHDHGLSSIYYEVGTDVMFDSRLRAASREFCLSGTRPEPWRLSKRFVVRGHWKIQPHGPERADRKMIFVSPYWKGPADAPVLFRAHANKDDT